MIRISLVVVLKAIKDIPFRYMYSDSVEVESVGDAGGLLYASKKYLMPQLSRQCLEYLVDNTCIKTLWDMLHIAETLDEEQLLKSCLKVGPTIFILIEPFHTNKNSILIDEFLS
jgi:hypothetical protein